MWNLTATQISLLIGLFLLGYLGYRQYMVEGDTFDVINGQAAAQVDLGAIKFSSIDRTTIANALNAAGGSAVVYHVADLQAAGALDPSISATTTTGGTYCLEFRLYNTSHIQGLLTVVGETHPNNLADAIKMGQSTGLPGTGYIASGNLVYPGGNPVPLSSFTGAGACNPGNNAFGALISDNQSVGVGTTNWLCRVAQPGNLSCSTMTLDLNMGGNNIVDANAITATGLSATGVAPGAPGEIDGTNIKTTTLTATGAAATGPLTITGNGSATGTFTVQSIIHTSDGRLKHGWTKLRDCRPLIDSLTYGRFAWNVTGALDDGVEAQSLLPHFPELVHADEHGKLGVNYDGLFPLTFCGITETGDAAARAGDAARAARNTAEQASHDAAAALAEIKALRRHLAALTGGPDHVTPLGAASRR